MRKLIVRCAAATAAVVALAGCSGADPKKTVDEALLGIGNQKESTTTMKLEVTPEDLAKLAGLAQADEPEDAATAKVLTNLIPKMSLSVAQRAHEGTLNDAKTLDKMDVDFKLAVDGKPLEIAWLQGKSYLRADVAGIGQATGLFTDTQLQMMFGEVIMQKPWLAAFAKGGWTELDPATVKAALEKAGQEGGASPVIDNAKASKLLSDNSKVTKGDDDNYAVAVDAKPLIKGLAELDPNDDLTTEDADEAIAEINDGSDLNFTVTVKDDKLTKAVFDLADLKTWPKPEEGPEGDSIRKLQAENFKLNLVMEFSDKAEIPAAPTDAVLVPADELAALGKLMSGNR